MSASASLFPSWRAGWHKPDRRPIWEWAHDNVTLPASYAQPGRLDLSTSRHLLGPLAAIQDDAVRKVTSMGAIQTGKSLISEVAIMWALSNSPGPTMLTMQTDDDAREHCNQRFFEALRSVRAIREVMPADRHLITMTDIYFGPYFLTVNGANLSNLQRVSIRWKFNSECWLWKKGLMGHSEGRVSAYEKAGNSKVVNESQGGTEGDDFHEAYKSGNQAVWGVRCFGCGNLTPLTFAGRATSDPDKLACVVWDADARRGDGTWNVARAAETARFACPNCGYLHEDSARTRAQWNRTGDYITTRDDAPAGIKSFRWEALVARPMADLVSQFLEARRQQKQGVTQAMQDFTRQRRALPWKEDFSTETVLMQGGGYTLLDAGIEGKIPNEVFRIATIDRQRDHFYLIVRAWCHDASSRLLYRSRTQTVEQLVDVTQRFTVEPQLVFEDSGYFPDGAYTDGAIYGWTMLKGSGENYFPIVKGERKFKRMYSDATRVEKNGRLVPLIHWASDPIKDVLHNLRSGKGAPWAIPDDAGPEYESQMNGDRKKEFVNKKTGRPEWRWVRTHANHYWDCEAMQVAAAMMLGILSSPEITVEKEIETAPQ